MARRPRPTFDRELAELPEPVRRREFMLRLEAVIFASPKPVPREKLAALIGSDCNLDEIIAEIREELRARPYDLVAVAGGYQHRTRPSYADVIRASAVAASPVDLSPLEMLVLAAVAYFQPVTRVAIADLLGKPDSRDVIAALRAAGLVATGPRSPQPGAPHTYVTTPGFLMTWGLESLRDLPDCDLIEEAGLLSTPPLPDELRRALGLMDETDEQEPPDIDSTIGLFDEEAQS
jgi:chromosome segregation and condensation protein ScpB